MEKLVNQQQKLTLPRRDMFTFDGDLTKYRTFIRAFETLIEAKEPDYASKLYYLEQYTSGRAQELVRSCLHMPHKEGYLKGRSLLEQKFGQKHKIAMAHVEKFINGSPIKAEDGDSLEQFSISLLSCSNTLKAIGYLNKIENPNGMKKIIERLPYKLQERWRDVADKIMNDEEREVTIEDIAKFVETKARSMNNPVFGKISYPSKDQNVKSKVSRQKNIPGPGNKSSTFVTQVDDATMKTRSNLSEASVQTEREKTVCQCCGASHKVFDCESFAKKSYSQRLDFAKKHRLCFACLKGGHQSKACFKKKPCKECGGKHATLLHFSRQPMQDDASKKDDASNKDDRHEADNEKNKNDRVDSRCSFTTTGDSITALPVVPVKVKKRGSAEYVQTYALLDSGSNSTFCTDSLRKRLGCSGAEKKIKLTTIGTSQDVTTIVLNDLEVTDLDENNTIPLPEVLCRPNIPVSKDEIPTQEDVDRWRYLHGYVHLHNINSEVELLIGANVPEALQPVQIIGSQDGGPYATKVALGWVINGPIGRKLGSALHASFFTQTKVHPMCAVCTDFIDASDFLKEMSRDDLQFMNIIETSVRRTADNHYEIALPVRDPALTMPYNRVQAVRRMAHLKQRFRKDSRFCEDYTNFVTEIIQKGYARKVPEAKLNRNDGRVWYLPHHGVYHPKKPEKIRVVYDCSAEYQGTSLNKQLYQGPDLTNNLVGVLTRFRQEKVAFMTDVEAMFHQVRVPESDCDLLRFLWWPRGDVDQ